MSDSSISIPEHNLRFHINFCACLFELLGHFLHSSFHCRCFVQFFWVSRNSGGKRRNLVVRRGANYNLALLTT